MKVYFVNPDYLLYPFPPLGLAYLAAYVKKYLPRIEVDILDQLPEWKILEKISRDQPEIICFSSTSPHHWKVKKLAQKVRVVSNGVLVLGGFHVTNLPKTIENSPFDMGIIGEGEITFNKLIESVEKHGKLELKELKKIPGFALRSGKELIVTGFGERVKNLDDIPMPARELLNMKYYTLPSFSDHRTFSPTGLMITSRGCPFSCSFCTSVNFWKRSVTFFSAERVAEEIEILFKKYGYQIIHIYDDLFTLNKQRIRDIVKILGERNLLGKIEFHLFGRGDCFDEEMAQLLKKMNVTEVAFGVETGSKRMLGIMKDNNITPEHHIKAINLCRKYGLPPLASFMIGLPHETPQDLEETYQFIKKHIPERFVVALMAPLPGTPVWDFALKNNLIKEDMYEKEERRFLEFNENYSLSIATTTNEVLKEYYEKMLDLAPGDIFGLKKFFYLVGPKNRFGVKKLFTLRPRHVASLMEPVFLKKAYNLTIGGAKQG